MAGVLVPEWLHQRAYLSPDRIALICDEETWTFAELEARAAATAARLAGLGARAGDRVALLARNSPEFVQFVWAAIRLGCVLVPVNTRLKPAEVAYQLRDADARFLIGGDEDFETAEAVGAECGGVRLLRLADVTSFDAEAGAASAPDPLDLDTVQGVLYTSGTTGAPKGAMLTYGNHFWSAAGSMLNLGLTEADRWLVCLPLFHIGGLSTLFKSVIYGMTVVLHRTFDETAFNRAIDEQGITATSVVATMLRRVIQTRGASPTPATLRCILLGGGPIPPDLVGECLRRGLPVAPTYGLTESCSQATTLPPAQVALRPNSAGKPLFPVEVAIIDGEGTPLFAGEAGEIVLRGPTVTPGYFARPQESARLLADGWLHTGDWGRLDDDGYLYILDRRDDIVISGGENVYPAEVEALLLTHPAVAEAGVFGLPDREWGQVVAATVVLHPGAEVDAEALRTFCLHRIAHFKAPRLVRFATELPRNAMGKLLRRELSSLPG